MNLKIKNISRLCELRSVLQEINSASYNFAVMNKNFPIRDLKTEEEAAELEKNYQQLILGVAESINKLYVGVVNVKEG